MKYYKGKMMNMNTLDKFPKGFKTSGVRCGIKQKGNDMALIYCDKLCSCAGVFTTNAFKAASVIHNIEKLNDNPYAKAIIVNSGNANACTGKMGLQNVEDICKTTAKILKIEPDQVLNASTGIIGVQLDMDKIKNGINLCVNQLKENSWEATASAIMTTDTIEKIYSVESIINEKAVRIGGICKGAGMICPNMATMLCFIVTDADIKPELLEQSLKEAVESSFNSLSVDGDMSTNDSVLILANGESNSKISKNDMSYNQFTELLTCLCIELAKKIAKDGEGATKFIEINVMDTDTKENAKRIALSIANSALVKTALFGEDPNWGRILCAAGKAGVEIMPEKVSLKFGDILTVKNGEPISNVIDDLKKVMIEKEIHIYLNIGSGNESAKVFTCDMSYEYVKINAEYHT
ncbi:MAG: bifunctional glutamate N-acetyltransferase/amino-acid acetyltransferase ArgJ [Armatimonadota bacterium]